MPATAKSCASRLRAVVLPVPASSNRTPSLGALEAEPISTKRLSSALSCRSMSKCWSRSFQSGSRPYRKALGVGGVGWSDPATSSKSEKKRRSVPQPSSRQLSTPNESPGNTMDLIGQTFGRLRVTGYAGKDGEPTGPFHRRSGAATLRPAVGRLRLRDLRARLGLVGRETPSLAVAGAPIPKRARRQGHTRSNPHGEITSPPPKTPSK